MRTKAWFGVVVVLVLLSLVMGCAARGPKAVQRVVMETVVVEVEKVVEKAGPAMEAPVPVSGSRGDEELDEAGERMIVRNVSMSIVVEDTDEALEGLKALVKAHKGYIADSNRWLDADDRPRAHITLRVPAESLDQVLEIIHDSALKVEGEDISGEDVTLEYTDLQARLRNLEAAEKELLALLTEVRENRGKAEDILAIHRELTNMRSQIESLKGRKQFLERTTALATIRIEIRPKEAPKRIMEEPWSPLITLSEALRGLLDLVKILANVAIYLLVFSPVVLIPAVILWLLVRLLRRSKKRKGAGPTAKEQ